MKSSPLLPIIGLIVTASLHAQDKVYLDAGPDFTITTDQGDPGLDTGDTVTWNGTHNTVPNLTFGTEAFTSIQAAIDSVNEYGTVCIAAGEFQEVSTVSINKSLTLQGDGRDLTILSGNNARRIFQIPTIFNSPVVLKDLTITAGNPYGISNQARGDFGGLTLTHCLLSNNTNSGAIDNDGTLRVEECVFLDNVSSFGGAINNRSELTVTHSEFLNNASGQGGAIACNGGTSSITNSSFSGNSSDLGGGAILNRLGSVLTVTNSSFTDNTANDNNSSVSLGGGAIANASGSTATLTHSTFSNNTIKRVNGGGVFNDSNGTLFLTNSTVTGNSTDQGDGGGVANLGTMTITHSTIVNNSAPGGDGGGVKDLGNLTIINSIIAGNQSGVGIDVDGSFTKTGVNFIGDPAGSSTFSGTGTILSFSSTGTTLSDLLNPVLSDNGGPTLTLALVPGSPAIDAADDGSIPVDLVTDQRNTVRISGSSSDIGAVEFLLNPTLVSTSPTSGSAGLLLDGEIILSFDQTVLDGPGDIVLRRSDNGDSLPISLSYVGSEVMISPSVDLPEGTRVYLEVDANALVNLDGGFFAGINDPTAFVFTTCFSQVYVGESNDFAFIQNQGAPGIDDGDTVEWFGDTTTVPGLTFGANAFFSIQSALDKVCPGGTVHFARGTYLEGSPVVIAKDVTLTGQSSANTFLSGNNSHRIVEIEPGTFGSVEHSVSINNIGLINGLGTTGGGAIFFDNAHLALNECEFSGHRATGDDTSGGAIAGKGFFSSMNINDCTFTNNTTNGEYAHGGAIFMESGALVITDSSFSDNETLGQYSGGGAIYHEGTLELTRCVLTGNDAVFGGGIRIISSLPCTIDQCTFNSNRVVGNSSILDRAIASGGGLSSSGNGNLLIKNSTFSSNSASTGNGGGIATGNPTTLINTTLSGNSANGGLSGTGRGGGLYISSQSTQVIHTTITGNLVNSLGSSGNGIYHGGDTLELVNSIVAGNGLNAAHEIVGNFISTGANFVGSLSGGTASGAGPVMTFNSNSTGGIITLNQLLDTTLGDNGGLTLTHRLVDGSPAIDSGDDSQIPPGTTTDQRGAPRSYAAQSDLGSVEIIGPPTLVSSSPESGFPGISPDTEIVLTYDQELLAGGGAILLKRLDTMATIPATVAISGNTVTITPTGDLPNGVTVYITIEEGTFLNVLGDSVAEVTDPSALSFLVCVDQVFLDDSPGDFTITNDQGVLFVPDSGDTVTWNGNPAPVTGLIFGVNAFTSLEEALEVVCENGTIHLAGGNYFAGNDLLISKSVTLQGDLVDPVELNGENDSRVLQISAGATVAIDSLTIRNGLAQTGHGGGILNAGELTMTNSTIANNETQNGNGGGIYNSGTLTVINSTFAENLTDDDGAPGLDSGDGGALFNEGTATLWHCTVAYNFASSTSDKSGGVANTGGSLTLGNSVVALNYNGVRYHDLKGSFTSAGVNFIGNPEDSIGFKNGVDLSFESTNVLEDELLYFSLTNAGGPTKTLPPVSGSPLIDAGNTADIPAGIITDQRGFPRILDGVVDLGAVESRSVEVKILTISFQGDEAIITAQGELGISYLLAFSDDLDDWFIISESQLPDSNGHLTFTMNVEDAPRRFFRLVSDD